MGAQILRFLRPLNHLPHSQVLPGSLDCRACLHKNPGVPRRDLVDGDVFVAWWDFVSKCNPNTTTPGRSRSQYVYCVCYANGVNKCDSRKTAETRLCLYEPKKYRLVTNHTPLRHILSVSSTSLHGRSRPRAAFEE